MATERNEAGDERDEKPEARKKSSLKLIVIAVAALGVLAGGAVTGIQYLKNADGQKSASPQPVTVTIWPMDAFVVNLTDPHAERYLKLVVQLELSSPAVVQELEQLKPKLRDKILDLLTPKSYGELMDLAGKQRLREDIAGRINNILSRGKVTKVYFTDFVIQ